MEYAIVTTVHQQGYQKYGKRMLQTFDEHWPKNVKIYMYYEGSIFPKERYSERVIFKNLLKECPDLVNFKQRWAHDPVANGMPDQNGIPNGLRRTGEIKDKWKNNHTYLWDAVRFSHKAYCQIYASKQIQADIMFWIDADTITFRDVSELLFKSWFPDNYYLSYLGREAYSECGFMGYDLKHQYNDEFMLRWKEMYDRDYVYKLENWTDCHTFDYIRLQMEKENKILCYDLNKERVKGHPFVNSILGDYMDHLKGKRKDFGRSGKTDIKSNKSNIGYWK